MPIDIMANATRWHAVRDSQALRQAALDRIRGAAADAIRERGQFHIVLAGGNTPRPIYRTLRDLGLDWTAWHVYFGDERCLPPDDPERNSRMAAEALLAHVAIPAAQLHVIPGELGAARAALAYARTLGEVGEFDLVLLGLGEDGHTAGLFSGHELGRAPGSPEALPVFDAPKPPPERVSLSAARLSRARCVLYLVEGEGKRQAVADWRTGKDIPARAIMPSAGVDVLADAGLLAPE